MHHDSGKGYRTRNDADLMAIEPNQEIVRKVDFLHSQRLCSPNRRSRSFWTKNNAKEFAGKISTLISGSNGSKNILHRTRTKIGLSSTSNGHVTGVIHPPFKS